MGTARVVVQGHHTLFARVSRVIHPANQRALFKRQAMLKEDPSFPYRDLAWSPAGMVELFNTRVLPLAWPGREATSVALKRMRYLPGLKYEALHQLTFRDRCAEPASQVLTTFANSRKSARRLEERQRRHYAGRTEPRSRGQRSPAVFLSELGCLIEFFPHDWRLPSLACTLVEGELTPLLAECLGHRVDLSGAQLRVEVLRYQPRKCCVVQIAIEWPEGDRHTTLIGKVYPTPESAKQVLRKQRDLHVQAAAQGLMIPRPLGVVEDVNLLIMEHCPGHPMKRRRSEAHDDHELEDEIRSAAVALTTLHGLEAACQEVKTIWTRWERLSRCLDHLYLVAPELRRETDPIMNRIARLIRQSDVAAPRLMHGDFKWSQLLVNNDEVVVLDVDDACLGDPALDVGRFMAAFYKDAKDARRTGVDLQRRYAEDFLAAYRAQAPDCDGLAKRARIVLAQDLVRLASNRLTRQPRDYARSGLSWRTTLLEEAVTCLDTIERS